MHIDAHRQLYGIALNVAQCSLIIRPQYCHPCNRSIYELNPGDTLDFEQAIVGRIQQLDMTFKRVDKPTDSDYYQYTWEKHQLYNEWYTLLWQKIEELKRSVRQQRKRPLNH